MRYESSGGKNQTTIVACGSATGQPIPPFVIFDAKQLNPLWTRDEVGGTRYGLSKIDRELFHGGTFLEACCCLTPRAHKNGRLE